MNDLEIHRLTPERAADFFAFFDRRAFEDNPDWDGCYCVFYHHDGSESEWVERTKEENREFAVQLIEEGVLSGFLAYRDGEPVGWCNVNEKRRFSLDKNRPRVASSEDDEVVAIVCFMVYHRNRRQGVSSALLEKVVKTYRAGGGNRIIEAYPLNEGVRGIHYHGPLGMYLKHGFRVHKKLETYSVVRLDT